MKVEKLRELISEEEKLIQQIDSLSNKLEFVSNAEEKRIILSRIVTLKRVLF
jgi:hypothetical protein